MKKSVKKAKVSQNSDAAIEPLAVLKLKVIRLLSANAKLDIRDKQGLKLTTIRAEHQIGISPDEHSIKVNMSCEVNSKCDEKSPPALIVKCEYQAIYEYPQNLSPSSSELEKLGPQIQAMSSHHIWPYIRHQVFSTTAQMAIAPLTLPLFYVHATDPFQPKRIEETEPE